MTAITKRRPVSEPRATYSVPALESDDSIIERVRYNGRLGWLATRPIDKE